MALLPPQKGEKYRGENGCFANYIDIFSGKTADKNRENEKNTTTQAVLKITKKNILRYIYNYYSFNYQHFNHQ